MAFMDFLFGTKGQKKTKPIYLPEQENVLEKMLGGIQNQLPMGLQNIQNILGGDQKTFQDFFAPARRGFEQKTLPSIAERFTGSLGEGSQRSSAFGQQLGQAGKEFEQDVFSQRTGMQGNAFKDLMSLLQPALGARQYKYTEPGKEAMLPEILAFLVKAYASSKGVSA